MNKELRAKTDQELIDLVIRLKGQLLQYRFKKAHGELEKHHLIKQTKRLLARVYTILSERKVNVNVSTKINNMIINQSSNVNNQSTIDWKKQQAAKKLKSKQRREQNEKQVAELITKQKNNTETKAITTKPIKKTSKTTKTTKTNKVKSKTKVKKTTNKLSSRTRRKGV